MTSDAKFAARLNELRIPHYDDLAEFPDMRQALIDRLNAFVNGDPLMVSSIPTADGRELLRVETQEQKNPKNRSIAYVWPRANQ